MVIGILSVRNHRYHPNRRLLEAARASNHTAVLVHPGRFFMSVDDQGLRIEGLSRSFRAEVIISRLGATIKEYALTMIRHFELLGVPVINNYRSILLARNKFLSIQTLARNGIPVPDTRYASNWSNFDKSISDLGGFPVVAKISSSRQGKGVFRIDSLEQSRPVLESLLNTGQGLLVQRFIPPEKRKDMRVMVVGEKVVGAMALTPRKGDFRANIHLHGRAEKADLTGEIAALAVKSTRALGLDISGVDMIGEKNGTFRVIDVNYSPGFKGLESCTGIDVASEIIDYVTE
jgi:ribosomal protein S6--L-glutamate ligase